MAVSTSDIQSLREKLGVGIMDAKGALEQSKGNLEKAEEILKAKGAKSAAKRADRSTHEGVIGVYVHTNGKLAAMVALACETDFVARTDDFKNLAHELALHIVASQPEYIKPEDVPADTVAAEERIWREQLVNEGKPDKIIDSIIKGKQAKYFEEVCLLKQPFVKDDGKSIEELITETIARLGENIQVTGFRILSL